jgi:hypothetical protein
MLETQGLRMQINCVTVALSGGSIVAGELTRRIRECSGAKLISSIVPFVHLFQRHNKQILL